MLKNNTKNNNYKNITAQNELVEETKRLVASERKIIQKILTNLKQIEREKIHLQRGHSSLFVFCTRELGYSEAAAQRRIEAMRALKEIPSLGKKLETGKLTLSTVALAQKTFRQEVKRTGEHIPSMKKVELFKQLEHKSQKEAEKILVGHYPQALPKREITRPLRANATKIQFVADDKLMAKLEKLKNKYSHKNPNPDYNELLHLMCDELLQEPVRRKAPPLRSFSNSKSSRYIPVRLKKKLQQRDEGQCQYQDPITGQKCQSTHLIQYDHIHPISKGGQCTFENLQLLCASHNSLKGVGTS